MGEVPTKPGHGGPQVRSALEDTLAAAPSVEPIDSNAAVKSIPPAERYRLGAELGRGGMGRVVEAFDLQLGRTVALKEVLPKGGPGVARRFTREVQLTARLEHPSIVPLYDAGVTLDGRPFYVMRRVSGRPLDQLMASSRELGERLTLLPALLAAIDAIAHAHRRRVIHRDLKPANILVGDLGDTVVIDWGLAKVIDGDDEQPVAGAAMASDSLRTQTGSVFGTPGFMAPEQARGEELDPRSDVYALGATLYQLLAGAPPHAGASATEMIINTGTRAVVPVDVIAPGAPPELVAIVGKALAFDPAGRYPNAGALGEDVRRFLAGQLVAAHRYTPRQRFARFTRRHRAPLSVAALAMAAVAVLAWVSVHRIVTERDAADVARAAAADGQRAAEKARDDARHRAEQLIVMHARGVVDANPTQAAAVLKDLPDASDRLGEARAVAQAAIARGAAWAIRSSEVLTTIAELSPDAKYLLQVTRDGAIRIWDLDRRRLVIQRSYAADTRAGWAGRVVLVTPAASAPELFDPFADTTQPVPVAPIQFAVASDTGRVAYLDGHGAAYALDVATLSVRPLWPGHVVHEIAIAADASWIAVADKKTVAVLDGDGRELTTHPGPATRLFGSRFGQIGYATADKVVLCTLSPQPTWTEVDLAAYRPAIAIDYEFRGRELDIYVSTGKVLTWTGSRLAERFTLNGFTSKMREAGSDLLIVPGIDGKLHVLGSLVTAELHLPVPLPNLRLVARAGASRVVVVGAGLIVGFDLAGILPEHLHQPREMAATFVDDDTLLFWNQQGGEWQWYDVPSGTATPFSYAPIGLPQVIDVDPEGGRVLVREFAGEDLLVLLRKNTTEHRQLARGQHAWGRLLPHGALVFSLGDDRLFGATDAGSPREIVKLHGVVEGAVSLGGARFAALSSQGELVRGNLATNDLERTRVVPGATWVLSGDRTGRALVAQDNRLMMWQRDLVEIDRPDQRILRIEPCDDGALLELSNHTVVRSTLVPGAALKTILAPSTRSPLISRDGKLVIGESINNQVVVFETATQATWDLPAYFNWRELATISPGARRFVQVGYGQLALWTLPFAPPDLSRWLADRTNAVNDGDYALSWSWQPRL